MHLILSCYNNNKTVLFSTVGIHVYLIDFHSIADSEAANEQASFLDSLDPLYSATLAKKLHPPSKSPSASQEKSSSMAELLSDENLAVDLQNLLQDSHWTPEKSQSKPRSRSFPESSDSAEVESKENSGSLPDSPRCTSPLLEA